MLYKCTAMFCVCVIGVAMADKRQPDGEVTTKKTFAESFLNVALEASKKWGVNAKVRRLLPYAERLTGKDAQVDVAFLRKIVEGSEEATRAKLAMLVLARTGGKEASDCLYTLLVNKPKVGGEVAFYMPPNVVRDAVERILVNRKEAKLQIAAAKLLRCVGEKNSLALLKRMLVEVDNATVRTELQIAISAVTRRLNDAPKGRELQWAMQELCYVRAWNEWRLDRSQVGGIMRAARLLVEEEALSVPFLRSKIKSGDMLAVAVAGMQRETSLVDDMAKVSDNTGAGMDGRILMGSLARIGNAAAIDVLAKRIKPGATEVNERLAMTLAECGTEPTVALLKKLSEDKDYKASWPVFKVAIKGLKERLQAKQREPKSQPSTGPASQAPSGR